MSRSPPPFFSAPPPSALPPCCAPRPPRPPCRPRAAIRRNPPSRRQPTPQSALHFIPLTLPTLTPGVLELLKLEGQFSARRRQGGGKAFASWFADDGVTLNNGKPAVRGRAAIAAVATWDPATTSSPGTPKARRWAPQRTGFTWGHYAATAKDKNGQPVTTSGRYITFWKKVNGQWKVALDASANDLHPATALPKP